MRYRFFAVLTALLCTFTMVFAFYGRLPIAACSRQRPEAREYNDCTPNLSQAQRIKDLSMQGLFTGERLSTIMSEEKANQREMFKVPMERIRQYIPNANAKQAEDFVLKACEHYRKFLIRQRNRDER